MYLDKDTKFYAVTKFPKILINDFRKTNEGDFEGESYLKLYIPGETFFFSFDISSFIKATHKKDVLNTPFIEYHYTGSSRMDDWQSDYSLYEKHFTPEVMFRHLNQDLANKSSNIIILEEEVSKISTLDFLINTKSIFKDYIHKTFNNNFELLNSELNPINTKVSDSFMNLTLECYNRQLDTIINLVDTKTFIPLKTPIVYSSFNKLIQTLNELETFKFKSTLEDSLLNKDYQKKIHKI